MAGTGNVILDEPRPVEVLHNGRWLPGWLLACRCNDRAASGAAFSGTGTT